MLQLLLAWLVNALCLLGVAHVVPGVQVASYSAALVAAVVIGLVNLFIRPVLGLLTLPITLLTLGLFSFVLNALMFGLAAYLLPSFTVDGFMAALLGSIAYGLLSWAANSLLLKPSS